MASGVPRCSVGTPSWLPATRPSSAPRARVTSSGSSIGPQVNTAHGARLGNPGALHRALRRPLGHAGTHHVPRPAESVAGSGENAGLRRADRIADARWDAARWLVHTGGRGRWKGGRGGGGEKDWGALGLRT